ncbi:MAG: prolyl oligopeptidase family serine peptidase [Anaerolineaceae bacterium]|nr:MAG: prolyl oligopeptidase family serine peptidase [Anaerolineaceae bacterium]
MANTRRTKLLVIFVFTALVLSACTNQAPPPTATPVPEPSQSPSPTVVPTLVSLPDGDLVYGDPDGRFSLPLIGDWTPVETDGAYARFMLADPTLELYVVATEADELEAGVEAALKEIGADTSALSLLGVMPTPHYDLYIYSDEDDQGVIVAVRQLGGGTLAFIATSEFDVLYSLPEHLWLSVDGYSVMPLEKYLEFRPPPMPSTTADIEDLNTIPFYSGGTKLVGRLTLPEGEGPFPALVYTGSGSGPTYRGEFSHSSYVTAGIAVFSYDKRGAGDSEGILIPAGHNFGEWRLGQLAEDSLAAVAFLQGLEEINPDQIGLMGTSQAGWTIPLAASRSDAVAYSVIVSGATVSLGEEAYWSELAGDANMISESKREQLTEQMAAYDGGRGFDPRQSIAAMTIPGLWIWGDLDGSVPARESRAVLEGIIETHDKDFSIFYYPNAGHDVTVPTSKVIEWILNHLEG